MNKNCKHIIRLIFIASLFGLSSISNICNLPSSFLLTSVRAANPNIINGKTPDYIDDNPCSESELIEYVDKAKKIISSKWQPVKGFEDRNCVAVFTVRQNGNIEEPKIVESSGSQAVDGSALAALKISSPLPTLPKGAPEFIQIRYAFAWHVTHKYDRTETAAKTSKPKKSD